MYRILFGLSVACFVSCKENVMETVDKNADARVTQLYSFLQDTTQDGIMFGHQDALAYGIGWTYADEPGACDVHKVCGDYPAVFGSDIGHIETGSSVNIDSVSFELMRQNILRAHKMGAINTVSWHPVNPVTGGTTWDISTRVVEKILPGGAHADIFKNWLTIIGTYFLSLRDDSGDLIPVLFRPYHEHTGNWFWWGNEHCTQEEYIQLWKYTVSYLRDTMQVHNLLYVYSTDKVTTEQEYLHKYPGDEWVDVLGADVYDFPHFGVVYSEVMPQTLTVLSQIGKQKNKPYALTETGNICVKPAKWWTKSLLELSKDYGLRWVLVWINIEEAQYYAPYPGQVSAEDFKEFYRNPATVFAGDLPQIFTPTK